MKFVIHPSKKYKHKWTNIFKLLLLSGLNLKNKLNDVDYYYPAPQREVIRNKLKKLLDYPINDRYKELFTFQKRMKKYENYIFTFLYYPKVPPDNNASERAIRNIKVEQKISGQSNHQQEDTTLLFFAQLQIPLLKTSKTYWILSELLQIYSTPIRHNEKFCFLSFL